MLQFCRKCLCNLYTVCGVSCRETRCCSVLMMILSNFLHILSWVVILCCRALFNVEKNNAWYCLLNSAVSCLCKIQSKTVGFTGICFLGSVLWVSLDFLLFDDSFLLF